MKEAEEDTTGCRKYSKAEIRSPMTLGGTSKKGDRSRRSNWTPSHRN
jgi:hypothetical protein